MSRVLPILFNTDMVQAVLEDRKTVTRRIAKGIYPYSEYGGFSTVIKGEWTGPISMENIVKFKSPYQPGDILYVRETWCKLGEYHYRADYGTDRDKIFFEAISDPKWCPSIHMQRTAARIWLKVMDVRVERLQEITFEGCLNEGAFVYLASDGLFDRDIVEPAAKKKFSVIWDSTIKKSDIDSCAWEANPWVWVIEFERCEKPKSWEW